MHENELRYQLALHRAPTIGPLSYRRLLKYFQTAEAVFKANSTTLKHLKIEEAGIQYLAQPDWHTVDQDMTWLAQPHHHVLSLSDSNYPSYLKQIYDPPPLLFAIGALTILQCPQLAIVGSRNPTCTGIETAQQLAKELSQAGLCITSGLALGIDAASHRGALAGSGETIAVLGNGLRLIYPNRHRQLAQTISQSGVLISEFPLNFQPRASHFPRRNRIISGLSLGTLVIEATPHSGSLITARLAAEQSREVFAVPGSIRNPLARGCNSLIQQGVKLVTTAQDVLEELDASKLTQPTQNEKHTQTLKLPQELDDDDTKLLECIDFEITTIDQLVTRTGWSVQKVTSRLLILELRGYIRLVAGGYVRLN